jgi:TM2 domain-containing membrane protein YozV
LKANKFCQSCGKAVNENAEACISCGVQLVSPQVASDKSDKDWTTTLLLCIFLGAFGGHRFYTGHTLLAIVMLLTLGCSGIWTLIDLIIIIMGNFRDSQGRLVTNAR